MNCSGNMYKHDLILPKHIIIPLVVCTNRIMETDNFDRTFGGRCSILTWR